MFSVAVMNAIIKSLIWLTGYSSSLREAKARAQGRNLKQKPWRSVAYWFPPRLMSNSPVLYSPGLSAS